jgi:hypothetical protein
MIFGFVEERICVYFLLAAASFCSPSFLLAAASFSLSFYMLILIVKRIGGKIIKLLII